MCAKYSENPTMLSKVTAKNVGDVFLRHTVDSLSYIFVANSVGPILTTVT